jgi:hypothetical protein
MLPYLYLMRGGLHLRALTQGQVESLQQAVLEHRDRQFRFRNSGSSLRASPIRVFNAECDRLMELRACNSDSRAALERTSSVSTSPRSATLRDAGLGHVHFLIDGADRPLRHLDLLGRGQRGVVGGGNGGG